MIASLLCAWTLATLAPAPGPGREVATFVPMVGSMQAQPKNLLWPSMRELDPKVEKELERLLQEGEGAMHEIKSFLAVLPAARASKDPFTLHLVHLTLAALYLKTNEIQKSREQGLEAEKALEGTNLVGDRAVAWVVQAMALQTAGSLPEALLGFQKALAVFRRIEFMDGVGAQLNNVGMTYQLMGKLQDAMGAFRESVEIFGKFGNEENRLTYATALGNLGFMHSALGDHREALRYLGRALSMHKKSEQDSADFATLCNNAGLSHQFLGEYAEALEFYKKALESYEKLENWPGLGLVCANIGYILILLEEPEEAIKVLDPALQIFRELKDERMEGIVLSNLGMAQMTTGKLDEAMQTFAQALLLHEKSGLVIGQGLAYINQSSVAWLQNSRPMAIALGKKGVNLMQAHRKEAAGLEPRLRATLRAQLEAGYRMLAQMLIEEGRLAEAQQVLDMLKEEELYQFVQRSGGSSGESGSSSLTPAEKEWQEKLASQAAAAVAAAREYEALARKDQRTPDEEKALRELEAKVAAAQDAFQKLLAGMKEAFAKVDRTANRLDQMREDEALVSDLADLAAAQKRTAAITTVVAPEKTFLVLTTPETRVYVEAKITSAELAAKIQQFRGQLQDPKLDPRPLGKELYDLLLKPLGPALEEAKAATLIFSLDGVMRYLPMGALYDGGKYLVERMPVSVFTPASRTRLKDAPKGEWRVSAFGASQAAPGFPALPGVTEELDAIFKVLAGDRKLDSQFNRESFLDALRQKKSPVIHVASHFSLNPGEDSLSFLLLGDGARLPLSDITRLPSRAFEGVELLTLSACSTAVSSGDGAELEGFAAVAQQKGVKAVLATLWPVDDAGTRALMEAFYRAHQSAVGGTKSDALRSAQLAMLTGSAAGLPGERRGTPVEPPMPGQAPPFTPDPKRPFAHPYYWAAFTLIGNFR